VFFTAAVLQIQRKLVSKALTIVFTGNTVIYALAPRCSSWLGALAHFIFPLWHQPVVISRVCRAQQQNIPMYARTLISRRCCSHFRQIFTLSQRDRARTSKVAA